MRFLLLLLLLLPGAATAQDFATLRPVVDRVFPFNQARQALAYVESGHAKGKVVLQMI